MQTHTKTSKQQLNNKIQIPQNKIKQPNTLGNNYPKQSTYK